MNLGGQYGILQIQSKPLDVVVGFLQSLEQFSVPPAVSPGSAYTILDEVGSRCGKITC